MTNISLKAIGTSLSAKANEKITSGSIGIEVTIEYDEAWNGLTKNAIFRAGKFARVRKNVGTATTVPWEVLRNHGKPLEIGIEGKSADGEIVIPTIWASVGMILDGANGDIPAAPNPGYEESGGGGAVIDDSLTSLSTTWSSKKIADEISHNGGISEKSLIVTISDDGKTASNTSEQIYDYVKNGRNVYLEIGNSAYLSLVYCTISKAYFATKTDDYADDLYAVDNIARVELYGLGYVSNDKLREKLAGTVKSVNGEKPGEDGNVQIEIGGGNVTDEQIQQAVTNYFEENPVDVSASRSFALLNNASRYPEFNSTAKTLTIPKASRIFCGEKVYTNGMTSTDDIVLDLTTERGVIYYDTVTGLFTVYAYNFSHNSVPATSVLIATYSQYGAIASMASAYKVDGNLYGISPTGGTANAFGLLVSQTQITLQFNTSGKYVRIYANKIVGSDNVITTPTHTNGGYTQITLKQHGSIVYDYGTSSFTYITYAQAVAENQILIASYADYGLKGISTASSYSVDGYPYGINTDKITAPVKVTSPDYERIPLPAGTPMWSDLFAIGDNIIAMVQSGDEEFTAKDGKMVVMDMNFNVQKTLFHDFGHCNTCHYNANTDTLLIGNLPGNTAYPGALYIFYDVSNWLALEEGTVLEFAALAPTIIDLTGLKTAFPSALSIAQIAACWGDNNAGENNIVYVSSQYNRWWFKIVLGKGANQYTYGTYTAQTDPARFNGTFNALEMYTRNWDYVLTEVTQGMDFYDGQVFTAESHCGARVLKWDFDTVCPYAYGKEAPFVYVPAATYETRLNYVYNPDGTILKVATEGILIKDGYIYIGVFFYDEGNGSKPANSVFSNSVFKYKI